LAHSSAIVSRWCCGAALCSGPVLTAAAAAAAVADGERSDVDEDDVDCDVCLRLATAPLNNSCSSCGNIIGDGPMIPL